jgi:SHS2 domain-containing protein
VTAAGIAFLDHTADVGMDVEAGSLEELLHRCAVGMLTLLRGEEEEEEEGPVPAPGAMGGTGAARAPGDAALVAVPIALRADDTVALLAGWLREVLFLHEVRGADYVRLDVDELAPDRLAGRVLTRQDGRAVREIKGVTYHALAVTAESGRWRARVIFDV